MAKRSCKMVVLLWNLSETGMFVGAALQGRDIVLRIIIEYISLKGFLPLETRRDHSS